MVQDAAFHQRSVYRGVHPGAGAEPHHGAYERTVTETDGDQTTVTTLASNGLEHLTGISDGLGSLWTFTPRTDGKVIAITNALGHTEVRSYTALGEVSTVQKPTGVGNVATADRDPSQVRRRELRSGVSYDDSLRQVSHASRGQETTYSDFTPTNDPQEISLPGGQITHTYDGKGRVLSATVSAGDHVRDETYTYDASTESSRPPIRLAPRPSPTTGWGPSLKTSEPSVGQATRRPRLMTSTARAPA